MQSSHSPGSMVVSAHLPHLTRCSLHTMVPVSELKRPRLREVVTAQGHTAGRWPSRAWGALSHEFLENRAHNCPHLVSITEATKVQGLGDGGGRPPRTRLHGAEIPGLGRRRPGSDLVSAATSLREYSALPRVAGCEGCCVLRDANKCFPEGDSMVRYACVTVLGFLLHN